jgi:hypothetical protein
VVIKGTTNFEADFLMEVAENACWQHGEDVWLGNGKQNGRIINYHFYKCPN